MLPAGATLVFMGLLPVLASRHQVDQPGYPGHAARCNVRVGVHLLAAGLAVVLLWVLLGIPR